MILNSVGNTKITIGNTQEYKTTIDVENLDFIATLLSSNLYSDPEKSFMREIVSNGWDSHVEANNVNTPIIVKFTRGAYYGDYSITIRDYGTGLSKEEFENLYCKIGSSTKRLSNNYLGCFGIGKFATMAVSRVSYITSYYNGIARSYVMTKDGNSITTNLVSECPTDEKNGLEVTIKGVSNLDIYKKALLELMFFPNVYVDGYSDFNNIKTKRYKNFSVSSVRTSNKLLLGNVLYPLKTDFLSRELKDVLNLLEYSGFVFNFNIGELAVTPNREAIIYNSKTEELIKKRILEALEEVKEVISNNIKLDFDNPYKYRRLAGFDIEYDFFEDKLVCERNYKYPAFNNKYLNLNITLKGRTVKDYDTIKFCESLIPNRKAVVYYDKVYKDKMPYAAQSFSKKITVPIIVINSNQRFVNHLNRFLVENYSNHIICSSFDFNDYTKTFQNVCRHLTIDADTTFVLQACYDFLLTRCIYKDFEKDIDFLAYKEEKKQEAKDNKVNIKNILLHVQSKNAYYVLKKRFDTFEDVIKYVKSLNTGVLFRNMSAIDMGNIASNLGYTTISANKTVIEQLKKCNFKCEVSEDKIRNNKKLVLLNSMYKADTDVQYFNKHFVNTLSKEDKEFIKNINNTLDSINMFNLKGRLEELNINIDEDVVNRCKIIGQYRKEYLKLLDKYNLESSYGLVNDITNYMLMKQKLYRISFDCYTQIKNNLILKTICQK